MAEYSDPRAIKALAHPLRMQLLHTLSVRGSATATELSDDVGESPSNCSFHLRKLAEFGYIERADDAVGREKPWRVVDYTQNFDAEPDDAVAQQAVKATSASLLEWDVAQMRASEGRVNPAAWKGASFRSSSSLIMTPNEARELRAQVMAIIEPFLGRLTDRGSIPDGAGVERLFVSLIHLPEHQHQLDASRSAALAHREETS